MSTCTKFIFVLSCLLTGAASAGGAGSRLVSGELGRRGALEALAGVKIVGALPFDGKSVLSAVQMQQQAYQRTHGTDYTVNVQVGSQTEKVFVSVMRSADTPTLNIVQLHVANPNPTLSQQRARVQVGLGLFNLCQPGQAQLLSHSFWQERLNQPWDPWQEAKVGALKVGWRGYENVPSQQDKYFVGSMDLRWPAGNDRCAF